MKHSLAKAIELHKKHISGTVPNSMKSQMQMMALMKAAQKDTSPKKK